MNVYSVRFYRTKEDTYFRVNRRLLFSKIYINLSLFSRIDIKLCVDGTGVPGLGMLVSFFY
jgi:hypothetical protein